MLRLCWVNGKKYLYNSIITYQKLKKVCIYIYSIVWIYVFVYCLCFELFWICFRCVCKMCWGYVFFPVCVCVCVCVFDMYCMCLNLSSEFVLWNLSWTKWLIESKELLCSILHPSTTTKSIVVANSPCQPPWLTWNFLMITLWQLVGFYVSMPRFTSTNMAPTWHLSRSWILTWVR